MKDSPNKIFYFIDNVKAEKYRQVHGTTVKITHPKIKNTGLFADAGIDLFAAYDFVVQPHDYLVVDSFVGFVMPAGVAGLVWPRGGDTFLVGSGVIDTGYTGTIKVRIVNPYDQPLNFHIGDSIGQLVLFVKGVRSEPQLSEVEKVHSDSLRERGDSGRIND